MRRLFLAVALLLPGCAKGTMGGNPFGPVAMESAGDDDDDGGSDTEPDEPSSADTNDPETTGITSLGTSSSGNDPTDETNGSSGEPGSTGPALPPMTSSTGGDAESSTSGTPPGDEQPASGMYAHCYDMFFDNCTAPSTICVNITGQMDGFCTADGCTNPALDCDMEPGGNAPPMCLAADTLSVCALDCSGGQTCPGGMSCETLSFDGITNYDLCI